MFIRWADAPGPVTSFYRMAIVTVILFPFFLRYVKKNPISVKPAAYLIPAAAGFFTAMDHTLWSTAINQTSVANATLLNNISPLWTSLFALIVFKERLSGKFWLGLVAILAGASAVLGSTILFHPAFAIGDILAIGSSVFYAGYFLCTQKGRTLFDTLPQVWIVTFIGAVCMFISTRTLGHPLTGYSSQTYLIILLAALTSQLAGYLMITYALGRLPASVVTPTMVAQPVITAVLAIPFAGEMLSLGQIAGGMAVLAGIYVINTQKER